VQKLWLECDDSLMCHHSVVLGYDDSGKQFPTFRGKIMPSSSTVDYPEMWHHIPEEWVPQLYLKTQLVPRSKHSVSVIQTNQLMLYSEIIALCSEIHTKHINTVRTAQ
jgi:hypothetical protein